MGLRNLERKIDLLKDFVELWKKLHDALELATKNKNIPDELEQSFLSIKTEIARQQAKLVELLGLENHFADEIMSILSQVVSLKEYLSLSPIQIKKIENQWHHLFIMMHGQLGKYEVSMDSKFCRGFLFKILKNPVIMIIIVVAGLVGFYILVKSFQT